MDHNIPEEITFGDSFAYTRVAGRVARRAARQICRWREKEGMIKLSELHDFFRRFAQRGSRLRNVPILSTRLCPLLTQTQKRHKSMTKWNSI